MNLKRNAHYITKGSLHTSSMAILLDKFKRYKTSPADIQKKVSKTISSARNYGTFIIST